MSLRFLIILSFVISLAGCSDNPQKPSNLIDEDTYTNLLVELQLVRSYGDNAKTDSATIDSLTTEVFQKYEVTRESFRESHQYYQQFPQEQKLRTEKAIEQLKMENVNEDDIPRDTLSQDQ